MRLDRAEAPAFAGWRAGGRPVAAGALLAAFAIGLFAAHFALALTLSVLAYALVGLVVRAGGTSLLALLACATRSSRNRPGL